MAFDECSTLGQLVGAASPRTPEEDDDFVEKWLDSISNTPPDGDCNLSPESPQSPIDDDQFSISGITDEDIHSSSSPCSSIKADKPPSEDESENPINEDFANLAALQLLRACYTLPAEYFGLDLSCRHCGKAEDDGDFLVSSLSFQCYHCAFPPEARSSSVPPRWKSGFDGPGGSTSEPASEGSPHPPTPTSRSKPATECRATTASLYLRDMRDGALFRSSRNWRLPRKLHVSEFTHMDGASEPDRHNRIGIGNGSVNENDEEGTADMLNTIHDILQQTPVNNRRHGKGRWVKEAFERKLHSLGRKLHPPSSTSTMTTAGSEYPDGRERRRRARQARSSRSASNSPFDCPVLRPQGGNDSGNLQLDPGRGVVQPVAVGGMIIAAEELDRLTSRADQLSEARAKPSPASSPSQIDATSTPKINAPPNTPVTQSRHSGAQSPGHSRGLSSGEGTPTKPPPNTPVSQGASTESSSSYLYMRPITKTGPTSKVTTFSPPELLDEKPPRLPRPPTTRDLPSFIKDHHLQLLTPIPDQPPKPHESPTSGPTPPHKPYPPIPTPRRRVSFDEKQVIESELNRLTRLVDKALQQQQQSQDSSSSDHDSDGDSFGFIDVRGLRHNMRMRSPPPAVALGGRSTVTSRSSAPVGRRRSEFLALTESVGEEARRRHSGPAGEGGDDWEGEGRGVGAAVGEVEEVGTAKGMVNGHEGANGGSGLVRRSSSGTVHILESIDSSGSGRTGSLESFVSCVSEPVSLDDSPPKMAVEIKGTS